MTPGGCKKFQAEKLGENSRGNTIGATGPRASDREICLRGYLRGRVFRGFSDVSEVLRGFYRFSEVFRDFSEVFRGPLRDPLRGRFPSQRLSVLLPLIVLPLELPPRNFGLTFRSLQSVQSVFSDGPCLAAGDRNPTTESNRILKGGFCEPVLQTQWFQKQMGPRFATLPALYRAQNQENREIPFSESKNTLFHPRLGTRLSGHFQAFNSPFI